MYNMEVIISEKMGGVELYPTHETSLAHCEGGLEGMVTVVFDWEL